MLASTNWAKQIRHPPLDKRNGRQLIGRQALTATPPVAFDGDAARPPAWAATQLDGPCHSWVLSPASRLGPVRCWRRPTVGRRPGRLSANATRKSLHDASRKARQEGSG